MWKPPGRDRIPCSYSEWSRRPVHTRWVIHRVAAVEIEQQLNRALPEAVGRLDASHVVDDEGHVDSAQKIGLRHDVLGVEMQHDVPSHRLDAGDQAMEDAEVGDAAQVLDEVEADAANAALVE